MKELTDNNIIPFGKYKGCKLANIPDEYLIWLYDNDKCNSMEGLKEYILDNFKDKLLIARK